LPLQPIQFAALRERGLFVAPAGEWLREHPEKIPLFGVQREAVIDGSIVEHIGPVAHRQEGRLVFLTVRLFAVDEGGDERERGEWWSVGRGVVGYVWPPFFSQTGS
jgi:hypothetical protein